MFGFKRGAHASAEAANVAAITAALREKLQAEVVAALAFAFRDPRILQADRDAYAVKAAAVRDGIDAVLLQGADAFGPELAKTSAAMRCGAALAHAARSLALLSGSLENANTKGDINFGIFGRR